MGLFSRKKTKSVKSTFVYDPETMQPVIRASICTGEQAAGFRDLKTGRFTEIMCISKPDDLREFMKTYGLTEVKKEY